MKLLIVSRADSSIEEYTKFTFPIIKKYCEFVGADFKILDHVSECKKGNGVYHYRIMKIKELLDDYDRVFHIDADILINKNCPNIFDEVPVDHIGTIYEDKGSRTSARHILIKMIQERYGNIGWKSGYINTGVFVVSKEHKDIFEKINNEFWEVEGQDDVHLGYNINKLGYKVHELSYKWNHMTMFSEPWNKRANRFNSYMIHYAGVGCFDTYPKINQIKKDFDILMK